MFCRGLGRVKERLRRRRLTGAGRDQSGFHCGPKVAQTPGQGLGINKIKMCEKFVISEVPEARGIVSHGVDGSGKVGPERAVAMVSLVESLELEKAGGGLRRRR